MVIFFLALKKNKIQTKKKEFVKAEEQYKDFLVDSENKLKALRDLYKQELIDTKLYIKKTEVIANTIKEKLGRDVDEFAIHKKNEMYLILKKDIINKTKKVNTKQEKMNIDNLISAVDKRIEVGFENEKR